MSNWRLLMQNGKRFEQKPVLALKNAMREYLLALHLRTFTIGIELGFILFATGCGSREDSKLIGRDGNENRVETIEALAKRTQDQPGDSRAWYDLGTELLKEAGRYLTWQDDIYYDIWDAMLTWRRAERILDEASRAFENALKLDSTNAHLLARAGHAYLVKFRHDPVLNDTGRLVRAISLLERSIQLDPGLVDALIDLGVAWTPTWRWEWEGDTRKAKSYIEKAKSLSPENGMVYYAMSGLYEAVGEFDEALPSLRKALDRGLSDEVAYLEMPARYRRCYIAVMEGEGRAIDSSGSVFTKIPVFIASNLYRFSITPIPWFDIGVGKKAEALGLRNPYFYYLLSDRYSEFKRNDTGFNYYMKAFELDSLNHRSMGWSYRGRMWLDSLTKRLPSGGYYGYVRAAKAYSGSRFDDPVIAKELLQRAIRLQPSYGVAYIELAILAWHSGEHKEAEELFQKALPLEFHEGASLLSAGQYLSANAKFDLALQCYTRILDLDLLPRPVVLYFRGMHYLNKGDRRAAHSAYLDLDRAYPVMRLSTWWGRGAAASISTAYVDERNYDKAIETLKRSRGNMLWKRTVRIGGYAGEAVTYNNIGLLYSKKGDSKNAVASYMKALEDDSMHAEAYYNLGEEYAKQGLKDKAIGNYKHAAKLGFEKAKETLQKLGETGESERK